MMWQERPRTIQNGLATITNGSGPHVLFIHGVGLRAEAWCGQLEKLAQHYRVIASLLDSDTLVVGHSMGAMIALRLAIIHAERITGVVALNAIFERHARAIQSVRDRLAALDGISPVDPAGPLGRWFGDSQSPERDACDAWLCAMDPQEYKAAYRVFSQEDGPSRQALASLTCSALFMTGGLEPNSTPTMSRTMASLAAKGRAMIVEDAAHMMPMTHPKTVTDALLSFATEVHQ